MEYMKKKWFPFENKLRTFKCLKLISKLKNTVRWMFIINARNKLKLKQKLPHFRYNLLNNNNNFDPFAMESNIEKH